MSIPRIDLRLPQAEVAAKLRTACTTSGFFYLVGHGVDEQLLSDALAASRDFFALPVAVKRRQHHLDGHVLSAAPAFRGYARNVPAHVGDVDEEGGREMQSNPQNPSCAGRPLAQAWAQGSTGRPPKKHSSHLPQTPGQLGGVVQGLGGVNVRLGAGIRRSRRWRWTPTTR